VSNSTAVIFAIPQGSILGPLFFSCYMVGISTVLDKHKVNYKIYADDL
jgi:hypothetical protein